MITALVESRWVADASGPTPGRHPKVADDFTLLDCADRGPAAAGVLCEIRCDPYVWEALVLDPEYGTACVHWYAETGRPKRVLKKVLRS
jgi:hypothetical protein